MNNSFREALIESYKHRLVDKASCIVCGQKEAPLALHIIQFHHSDSIVTPDPLVAMSSSRGGTRGSVPLCRTCCPPCVQCELPILTLGTKKLIALLTTRYQGITFVFGNGVCRHVHILHDFKSLFRQVSLAEI